MFGDNDQNNQQTNTQDNNNGGLPGATMPSAPVTSAPETPVTMDATAPQPSDNTGFGFDSTPAAPAPSAPIEQSVNDNDVTPVEPQSPTEDAASDLSSLKQSALQQLGPLVGHLDQTPEEKFRTTMMMIQASDDQSLIQSAFDTAQTITDEKARAQALLDVINEINYFTQQNS